MRNPRRRASERSEMSGVAITRLCTKRDVGRLKSVHAEAWSRMHLCRKRLFDIVASLVGQVQLTSIVQCSDDHRQGKPDLIQTFASDRRSGGRGGTNWWIDSRPRRMTLSSASDLWSASGAGKTASSACYMNKIGRRLILAAFARRSISRSAATRVRIGRHQSIQCA